MARPTLERNVKLKRLVVRLGLPRPYVRGLLETMWDVAHETGDPVLGLPADVEAAAEWPGDEGAFFAALRDGRWLDRCGKNRWQIHDYWDHAPDYVRKRRQREQQRQVTGRRLAGHGRDSDQTVTGQCPQNGRTPAPTPTLKKHPSDAPPVGPPSDSPASHGPARPERPPIPAELLAAIPRFAGLWRERMSAAGRKRPNASAEGKQLEALVGALRQHGTACVIAAVEDATRGGYQGIFPEKFARRSAAAAMPGGARRSAGYNPADRIPDIPPFDPEAA